MTKIKLSANQRLVMAGLSDTSVDHRFPFAAIGHKSGLDRHLVRRTVRALARKGLLEYERSLWNEDGEMVGSGYGLTAQGAAFVEAEKLEPPRIPPPSPPAPAAAAVRKLIGQAIFDPGAIVGMKPADQSLTDWQTDAAMAALAAADGAQYTAEGQLTAPGWSK